MRATRLPLASLERGIRALSRDEAHYLTSVRRLGVGAAFVAFDPERGHEAEGRLVRIERAKVEVELSEPTVVPPLPGPSLCLVQAVGKGDKLDQVLRDATELGVARVCPALATRSVARRDSDAATQRLRRIAVEASRQCGRGRAPSIEPARPLADVLAADDSELRLLLDPGAPRSLRSALDPGELPSSITVVVGPEGGFDEAELALAARQGFLPVRLGTLVLRTETAATAVLGALRAMAERG